MCFCLVFQGAPPERDLGTQLLNATNNNAVDATVRDLLNQGADPNSKNQDGVTPLMIASYLGNVSTVKLLISRGADVGIAESKGNTALIYALAHDRQASNGEVVELLLSAGADANHETAKKGNTTVGIVPSRQAIEPNARILSTLYTRGRCECS